MSSWKSIKKASANPCSCTHSDAWKMAYDIIKLENDLINHRLTALLVSNGFFIAALCKHDNFFSLNDREIANLIALSTLVITWSLGRGIAAASRQILKTAQWYYTYCRENLSGPAGSFSPPLVGYATAWNFFGFELGCTVKYDENRIISDEDSINTLGTGVYFLINILILFWLCIIVIANLPFSITVSAHFC